MLNMLQQSVLHYQHRQKFFLIRMRKITFLITLFCSISIANCQVFKGTVYDRSTDSTLSFAIVYISGTSIGTYSDEHGNFTLDISRYSSMPITISLLSYYSVTLSEHGSNKMYDIFLSPKIKELDEVVVTAKGHWKTYMRMFEREFLGETKNAMECNILNEKDLRFSYDPDSNTLRAFSSEPVLIHNKALGYSITYYLDKFQYSAKMDEKRVLAEKSYYLNKFQPIRNKMDEKRVLTEKLVLLGNYLFKDDILALSESEKRKVEARRKSAYVGSRMHFFRLLYQGDLVQNGKHNILLSDNTPVSNIFSIGSKTTINSDSFVIRKDSISSYIKNEGEFSVVYRSKSSTIYVNIDSGYFQKNGYFDPIEITFSGDMSRQRIGDLLPFEYSLR